MFADVGGDGTQIGEAETEEKDKVYRNFKITKRLLEKCELTPGCPGCEPATGRAGIQGSARPAMCVAAAARLHHVLRARLRRQQTSFRPGV